MQHCTVYVGADLWGVKHNAALPFVRPPTLGEVVDAARVHFDVISQAHRPAGYPDVVFDVVSVQVLAKGAWEMVDFGCSGAMVRQGSQFWLFQPESMWHSDAAGVLPVPQTSPFYLLLDPTEAAAAALPRRTASHGLPAPATHNDKVAAVFARLLQEGDAAPTAGGASPGNAVPATRLLAVLKRLGAMPTLPPSHFLHPGRIVPDGTFDVAQWKALAEQQPFALDFLYYRLGLQAEGSRGGCDLGLGLDVDASLYPAAMHPAPTPHPHLSSSAYPAAVDKMLLEVSPPPAAHAHREPHNHHHHHHHQHPHPHLSPTRPTRSPVPAAPAAALALVPTGGAALPVAPAVPVLPRKQPPSDAVQLVAAKPPSAVQRAPSAPAVTTPPPAVREASPPVPAPEQGAAAGARPVHNIHYVHELPAVPHGNATSGPPPRAQQDLLRDLQVHSRNVDLLTHELRAMDEARQKRLEQQHQNSILGAHQYPPYAGYPVYHLYSGHPHTVAHPHAERPPLREEPRQPAEKHLSPPRAKGTDAEPTPTPTLAPPAAQEAPAVY
eukprot:TRINITY_DN8096_c0_g1_i1.p1 TRINITY_DN8096_c0_g1~~TRINITY_DN8096_c0_g1_i1.p1  ORF type:complete len:551 (+),score=154.91 TRINITY_DN8096_c0_g1_i1:145-1797(+)